MRGKAISKFRSPNALPRAPTPLGTERILRCCMWCGIDFCLYAAVFRVERCADLVPGFFCIYSGTLYWYSYTSTIPGQDAPRPLPSPFGFYLFSYRLEVSARGRGYRPGQGLRRGIQLRFREMAKSIAAGPELAVGSNSWPCRNNALSRNLSCITPPPQQPEPISSPSGWHFQPVGKKIKPERGRKRTRGVLSWDCERAAVSA